MISERLSTLLVAAILFCQSAAAGEGWSQLPPLPDKFGLAAPFAGMVGGALVVAGGANFPQGPPWEGGKKAWQDAIYALPGVTNQWQPNGRLPHSLAYGVSVTTPQGLVCVGGSDAKRHYADVFLLQRTGSGLRVESLPPLPKPLANSCGALLDGVIYIAGGTETPETTNALENFWALDLRASLPKWRELEPWPGPARMLAVAGVLDGAFHLFSGAELAPDAQGKPVRRYLREAYRYRPGRGWERLADLPRGAVAAPSPAVANGQELLLVSGDDGTMVHFEPKSQHPGFARTILAFSPRANQWREWGASPFSRATVPTVEWAGRTVIPGGETRPGCRTPEVWALESK